MICLSNAIQEKIYTTFAEENISLISHFFTEGLLEKVLSILERTVLYSLFCPHSLKGRVAFTIVPYKLPSFFQDNTKTPFRLETLLPLLAPSRFVCDGDLNVKDQWDLVNKDRNYIFPAFDQGLSEIIAKYRKDSTLPHVEIGSGMGYTPSLEDPTLWIRTQPSKIECKGLARSISDPIYQMDIKDLHAAISKERHSIPLFWAVNVFDTMTSRERKENLTLLSKLQNPGDQILILLDTNPLFNLNSEDLQKLHPGCMALPFLPIDYQWGHYYALMVPHHAFKGSANWKNLKDGFTDTQLGNLQPLLHFFGRYNHWPVVDLTNFFIEKMQEDLRQMGYKHTYYYHSVFTEATPPEQSFALKSDLDLIYKPLTDMCHPIHQWKLDDPSLLKGLSEKGISLPLHLNPEYVSDLRKKGQKILGTEILVIEATKL